MLDAALLLNTMERGPGVSAAPSDGPRDAGEFWWKGTRYEIPPTPWKLLAFVWQQENRRASFADVAEQVWGDDTKHRRNIDRHLSTINNALMATGISLHAKNETVSIDLP
jgi:DNA-binding response OmpR family regulator